MFCVNLTIKHLYMKHVYIIFLLLLVFLAGYGCSDNEKIAIQRFDRIVVDYPQMNNDNRDSVLSFYSPVISFMQNVACVSNVDTLMNLLAQSRAVTVFQPDIERLLPDVGHIEYKLGALKRRVEKQLPSISFPKQIYGAVIPYDQSVIVLDSSVIVGLNHYLGAEYEGYAAFEDYRRVLKEPERMVYDVAEAMVRSAFPYIPDSESTLFSRIAYEGLIVCVVKSVVEDSDLASVLGYDNNQLSWAVENESKIWQKIVSDNLLYSTDPSITLRLVEPSPASLLINSAAPGRIGRYVGYRIVLSYLDNNSDVSIESLLKNEIYRSPQMLVDSDFIVR